MTGGNKERQREGGRGQNERAKQSKAWMAKVQAQGEQMSRKWQRSGGSEAGEYA